QNVGMAGGAATVMALQDPVLRDAYRKALEQMLRNIFLEANLEKIRSLDTLLNKIQKGDLSEKVKGLILSRARSVDKSFRAEYQKGHEALSGIQNFQTLVTSDPELSAYLSVEMGHLATL